jgi:hypothetical protein
MASEKRLGDLIIGLGKVITQISFSIEIHVKFSCTQFHFQFFKNRLMITMKFLNQILDLNKFILDLI